MKDILSFKTAWIVYFYSAITTDTHINNAATKINAPTPIANKMNTVQPMDWFPGFSFVGGVGKLVVY